MNASQTAIAQQIYTRCINGTANNPGLPPALAQLVVGQSYNETNGWTSNFFVNNNNCFGYECSSTSIYQNGCSSGNADNGVTVGNYDTVDDSTQELIDWIYRRVADGKFPSDLTTITTADQYASLLSNAGYFTSSASSYASRINAFLSQVGTLFQKH